MLNAAAASSQPSSRRPVPVIGRHDLIVSEISFRGVLHYVVKDPVGLKYHCLRAEQFRLLQLLDGQRTLEALRELLIRELPTIRSTLRELQQVIADLHQKGLAYSARSGQSEVRQKQYAKQRRQKITQTLLNVLSLRLPGWDPDAVLRAMLPGVRWMFHPWGVAACLAFVLSSWITLALHWSEFQHKLPAFHQFFGWPNLIFLWLTLAGAKICHEFGHGLSCRYFGGECHEMGIMLLVFSPSLYCDVSDSWMLPNKWQRMIIGAAGMYVEVLLSAIAIYIWQATSSGLWHYLSLNLFFVTAVTTVIFNANPLLRLDGYYILSDWLEIPNLRPHADQFLRNTTAKACLGLDLPEDPFAPKTGRVWFVLFAIASHVYSWFVLSGILIFLFTVLKPYGLQSLGQTAAWFSLGSILGGMVMQAYQIWKAPRAKPISRWRLGATVAVLSLVVAAVLQIPIPWYRTSSCLVEPRDIRNVLTKVRGQIAEVFVSPGDFVTAGQVLVRLVDPEIDDRWQELQLQIRTQQAEAELQAALDDLSTRTVVLQTLSGLREQERELAEHREHFLVRAPCAGVVVAPPRKLPPTQESQQLRLPTWHATPLDPRNRAAFLQERTELLSLAPQTEPDLPLHYQAVVYLDQSDLLDVRERMRTRIKLDHWPQETFTGFVQKLAEAETDIAPPSLSNKQGGHLATVTDREGREKLEQAAYQMLVEFEHPPEFLRTGLRGRVRFLVSERSLGQWLWRDFRKTFHFEL